LAAEQQAMPASALPASRSTRFALNVFWNWLGVGVNLIFGFFLLPYLVRKLGAEGYGVWTISFSMLDYFWLVDLGFRSAAVKFVAHYLATGEEDKIREVVNTALVYSSCAAALILTVVCPVAPYLDRFFKISPSYRSQFPILVILITFSWCLGTVFNLFGACLDSAQRFDLSNRVSIVGSALRTMGTGLLLYFGHGLIAIGLMTTFSQIVMYVLNYWMFRRLFPRQRLSPRYATRGMLRQMGSFGIHTFLTNIGNQISAQTAPLLLGHYREARFAGYYNLPVRLLQYTVEMVGRIGLVTNTNAAELAAKNESGLLVQLAILPNRYCLMIFMPLAILLFNYGDRLFRLWVGPDVAAQSGPLLPILLIGSLLAIVGQFSSSMLLQGLGRHQAYARGLLAEALGGIVALIIVIPRFGMLGAAIVTTTFMVLNRAIYASWLTSRVVAISFREYVTAIYAPPFLTAIPVYALLWWLRRTILPGDTWRQLAEASTLAGAYYALALFTCIRPDHRMLVAQMVRQRLSRKPA
jgi:O-antigen/teichoic acid export membrane protein